MLLMPCFCVSWFSSHPYCFPSGTQPESAAFSGKQLRKSTHGTTTTWLLLMMNVIHMWLYHETHTRTWCHGVGIRNFPMNRESMFLTIIQYSTGDTLYPRKLWWAPNATKTVTVAISDYWSCTRYKALYLTLKA